MLVDIIGFSLDEVGARGAIQGPPDENNGAKPIQGDDDAICTEHGL